MSWPDVVTLISILAGPAGLGFLLGRRAGEKAERERARNLTAFAAKVLGEIADLPVGRTLYYEFERTSENEYKASSARFNFPDDRPGGDA